MMKALETLIHVKSEEKQNNPKTQQVPITKIDPNKQQVKADPSKTKL